ncbi:hypothetical protein [Sagittula sp.]|jgi:hypothetical protein|uniref:hypothetical protein n=1 Tax=Sagittula sp. TaxID=2038081 RepID=UPI0035192A22
MKRILAPALVAIALLTPALASAACSVEYKAKQDDPLRLDHGTIVIDACESDAQVEREVRTRLAAQGWILLKILGTTSG